MSSIFTFTKPVQNIQDLEVYIRCKIANFQTINYNSTSNLITLTFPQTLQPADITTLTNAMNTYNTAGSIFTNNAMQYYYNGALVTNTICYNVQKQSSNGSLTIIATVDGTVNTPAIFTNIHSIRANSLTNSNVLANLTTVTVNSISPDNKIIILSVFNNSGANGSNNSAPNTTVFCEILGN